MRKNSWKNELLLTQIMQVEEKYEKAMNCVKITVPFIEHPTLYDYYRLPHFRETHQLIKEAKHVIFFFEEMFELIVKAGGI